MNTTQPIQSLDRGLVLLEAVAHARQPVSLSELMPVLGIDRSSVFRLANTLVRRGFLVQMPDSETGWRAWATASSSTSPRSRLCIGCVVFISLLYNTQSICIIENVCPNVNWAWRREAV
jgi:hypothetical protein